MAGVIDAPLRLHETEVVAEWADYNGHMTESAYLLIVGDSADAFFRYVGVDDDYRAAGRSLFTAETHLRHLGQARTGDRLRLSLQVLGVDAKRLHIAHEIRSEDGAVLATAEQLLLHVDLAAGRATPFPAGLAGRLAQIRAAHAALPRPGYAGRSIQLPRRVSAVDTDLTQEQRLIAGTVRDFVERELYPHEDEVERLDEVPPGLADEIRAKAIASGLYAANMPAELGGGGLDATGVMLAERELGRASYALQMLVERPSNILQACEGEQRERYLLPAIRGERHDCVAMTEPGAGSDVRSMSTTASRSGNCYVISGTKHFISHADVADFVILFAATGVEQTSRGPKKLITTLLVDKNAPGLEVRRGPPCVSNRGYHQCELIFSGCKVPVASRLGEEGRGFELMGQWLGATRLTVAATSVGRARRVLEAATEWAANRRQFGQPIGRFQGVGFRLADMATELEAAELLTLRAAARLDRGAMTDADAAMAKLYASEMLGRVTDTAVQTFGGMGLMGELPVERWWRDARVERIWDGTSEIQRQIIARSLLRPYGA